jgi:hypothetical protein
LIARCTSARCSTHTIPLIEDKQVGHGKRTRIHNLYPRLNPNADDRLQILFLAGITLLLGVQRTFLFFARRQKIKGTAAFVAGIILILLRWPLIGFLVEIYGIFILFGEFFKTIAGFAYNVPVVGPYLARGLQKAGEKAGEGNRNKDLPV